MKIYILFLSSRAMNDIVGCYESLESAELQKKKLLEIWGSGASGVILSILEKELEK